MISTVEITKSLTYDDAEIIKAKMMQFIQQNVLIEAGSRVAVKLNLLGPFKPENAATTHPVLVAALVEALMSFNCIIMLCEDIEEQSTLEKTGISEILEKYHLQFYNLCDYGYEDIEIRGITFSYSSLIKNCDVLISMPKFKTHLLTNYTGAIKNMYGCISKKQRKSMHLYIESERFAAILCSIYTIRLPNLVIMDAIIGMEGVGPSFGDPRYIGYLIMGTDGISIDYYSQSLMGYKLSDVDTTVMALEWKISISSPEDMNLTGCCLDDRIKDYKRIPVMKDGNKRAFINVLRRTFKVNLDLCTRCGRCVENCPFGVIIMQDGPTFDKKNCMFCSCCMELCPVNAINFNEKKGQRL